ncbi:MAG: hypothetical protein VKJ24_15305 [Synechococcales bacterium]|nr:hypothetical protein [Synechococcales bacterium]
MAQLVVTIEATIPFRSTAELNPAEQLFTRLLQTNQQFDLGMTRLEMEQAIHRAVKFANRDVENFSFADPVIFLDKTWQILPELNPPLRNPSQYSIRDYCTALRTMESFFLRLNSQQIFQQFRQVPNALTLEALQGRSQHNLEIARLYLSTKIVAIAILEALLSRRNPKQPVSHWLGSLAAEQWEQQFLNLEAVAIAKNLVEQQVLQIVDQGRTRSCQFDLIKSPFTAFLLRSIGFDQMTRLRPIAEEFFIGALDSEQFLELVPYFEQMLQF